MKTYQNEGLSKRKYGVEQNQIQPIRNDTKLDDLASRILKKVQQGDNMKKAIEFGIIGVGQAGGRLSGQFEKLGYKCLNINTSEQDLAESPTTNKLVIGNKIGAGRDLKIGAEAINTYKAVIINKVVGTFGNLKQIIICCGSSGGSGGGGVINLLRILKESRYSCGVITTLPLNSEDTRSKNNTLIVLNDLVKYSIAEKMSPFIIVDNAKIEKKYPGLSTLEFWNKANDDVVKCFNLFNVLAAKSSSYTSFDPADYTKLIHSGGCMIFGQMTIDGSISEGTLAESINKNIDSGLLADGFNLMEATHAACVIIGSKELLYKLPRAAEENAFQLLNQLLGSGTIFKGVYELPQLDHIEVIFMIGGLGLPGVRIKSLVKSTKEEVEHLEKKAPLRTVDDILKDMD